MIQMLDKVLHEVGVYQQNRATSTHEAMVGPLLSAAVSVHFSQER